MSVPKFEIVMLPLLQRLALFGGATHDELLTDLGHYFNLSSVDQGETLKNGSKTLFSDRVGWAKSYLKAAGLIDYVKYGKASISQEGKNVVEELSCVFTTDNKPVLNRNFLKRYPSYLEFINRRHKTKQSGSSKGKVHHYDKYDVHV